MPLGMKSIENKMEELKSVANPLFRKPHFARWSETTFLKIDY